MGARWVWASLHRGSGSTPLDRRAGREGSQEIWGWSSPYRTKGRLGGLCGHPGRAWRRNPSAPSAPSAPCVLSRQPAPSLHLTCREVPTSAALGYLEGSFFVSSFPLLVSKFIGRPDAQCLPCIVGHVTVASVQGEVWEELTAHPKSQNVHLVVRHRGSGEQRESGKDPSTRAQLPLPHGDHLQG